MSEEKRVATAEILNTSVHVSVNLNNRYQGPPGPPGKDGTVRFEDLTAAQIEQLRGPQGLTGKTPQITVQVETGEPGTEASVIQSGTAEAPVIALTIPRGNVGATPQITVQVKTGEPGTAASVKQTGTAEAPVIELTIPRGDTGSLGNLTINGKAPDAAGKVTLTAANVGAASAAELSQLKSDLSDLKFKHKRLYTSKDNAVNLGIDYGFVVLSFKSDSDAGFSAFGSTLFCTIYQNDLIALAEKHVSENADSWVTNVSYSNGVLSFNNTYTGIIDIIAIGT